MQIPRVGIVCVSALSERMAVCVCLRGCVCVWTHAKSDFTRRRLCLFVRVWICSFMYGTVCVVFTGTTISIMQPLLTFTCGYTCPPNPPASHLYVCVCVCFYTFAPTVSRSKKQVPRPKKIPLHMFGVFVCVGGRRGQKLEVPTIL